MRIKSNLIKRGRCELCSARLRRRDFCAIKRGCIVIIEATCTRCGQVVVIDSQPTYKAQKRPKARTS